ncbi:MAG: phospho-N-acetylmuramoyl-pentapeptide-transferase [Candidatus Caldatribacteriaceae bacterium]
MADLVKEATLRVLIAWAVGMLLFPPFIRWQRRSSLGQKIKKEGPAMHLHKENTPTMGGVVILFSALLTHLLGRPVVFFSLPLLILFGFFLLGFFDDYWKSVLGRPWGLKARYRFAIEVLLAGGIMWWGKNFFPPYVILPFTGKVLPLGNVVFFLYGMFILLASCNAFNIADGLDGLAAGCGILTFVFWGVFLALRGHTFFTLLSFAFVGGLLAFLWFNAWPAEVFLGDSGSLFLGALMGVLALSSGQSLLLVFSGIVFVVDTLSVVIQVVSFRFWGRRVFLMSPLHHHFELRGEKETRVTARFWLVQALGVLLAFSGMVR